MSVYDALHPDPEQLRDAKEAYEAIGLALWVDDPITQTRYQMDPPCTTAPGEFFHAKSLGYRGVSPAARALCNGCPAQLACGVYAAIAGEKHGTWGGVAGVTLKKAFADGGVRTVLAVMRSELSRGPDAE